MSLSSLLFPFSFSLGSWLLELGACLLYAAYVIQLLCGLMRFRSRAPGRGTFGFISVIVAARNEERNIAACIDALAAQDYARDGFEVIIVDDDSHDNTLEVATKVAAPQVNMRVMHIGGPSKVLPGKKGALEAGIGAAQGDILAFTDADCRPRPGWLRGLAAAFDDDTGLVAGFAPLTGRGWLGGIIVMDTLSSALTAAAGITLGSPVTCTGRSLAYRRQVYDTVGGFRPIAHSVSGDDDLFMHAVRRKTDWGMRYLDEPSAHVISDAPVSLRAYLRQKRRHLSAGQHYPRRLLFHYGAYHAANLVLWAAPLILPGAGYGPLFFLVLKWMADLLLFKVAGRLFGYPISIAGFIGWEVILLLNHIISAPLSTLGRIEWKAR